VDCFESFFTDILVLFFFFFFFNDDDNRSIPRQNVRGDEKLHTTYDNGYFVGQQNGLGLVLWELRCSLQP
jgi:hypothetical protein